MKTLLNLRDSAIAKIIEEEVKEYLFAQLNAIVPQRYKRSCPTCGVRFHPRNRHHFFNKPDCRKVWYRGVFKR
jgi:hypothetical protein